MLAPFAREEQTQFPLFLAWYENCDPRGCDTDRDRAQERLIECLNDGLRKGHSHLAMQSGGRIDAAQPSALVEDPRLNGQPDARLTSEWSESLVRKYAKYAVVMEASVRRDVSSSTAFRFGPAAPMIFAGQIGGTSEFTEEARFDIAIVDATTRLWVARARRSHAGNGSETAGVAFTIPFLLPLPLFGAVSAGTERASCVATGQAIGEFFRSTR